MFILDYIEIRPITQPLFYEMYPGSIVDVSQLHYTIGKAKGYGFEKIGFILDRGYFSKGNIRELDQNGYSCDGSQGYLRRR